MIILKNASLWLDIDFTYGVTYKLNIGILTEIIIPVGIYLYV